MWLLLRAVAQLNAFHPGSLAFNHNNKHCHIKCYQIEIRNVPSMLHIVDLIGC